MSITYNVLNLQQTLSQSGTAVANYSWLAEGTKCAVVDNGSGGYDYLGSLIYTRNGSTRTLESTDFGGGRIVYSGSTYSLYYYITDHLGSIRTITDNSGIVREQNDYYPFGGRHANGSIILPVNKQKFNGKELQTTGGTNFIDYGARMYDPALGRWHVIDPIEDQFSSQSPYSYVGNNPIKRIDPDGQAWYDAVIGTAIGVATNIVPGSTSLRNAYTPTDASDYNNALRNTDAAAMAFGKTMVKGGGATAVGGLAVAAVAGTASLAIVDAPITVPVAGVALTVAEAGAATAAGGAVLMANGSANAAAGYNYGAEDSYNQTSTEVKTRQSKGADGATSKHIIEKDDSGKTVSKTHQVTGKDGNVVHQHQDFISQTPQPGQKPVTRQFPDEWVKFPNINNK